MRRGAETIRPKTTNPDPVRDFDRKYRYNSSLDAMKQDPLYQWLVSQGDQVVSKFLIHLVLGRKPTWLMMALDEITGQDVTGLRNPDALAKGITLPVMYRNVIHWAENESRIGIQSRAEVNQIGARAMEGFKGLFMPAPAIQQAVTEALFMRTASKPITKRSITADLIIDGQPSILSYSSKIEDSLWDKVVTETATLADPANPEKPTLFLSTSQSGDLPGPYFATFSINDSRMNNRRAEREIAEFIGTPHTIEATKATATLR